MAVCKNCQERHLGCHSECEKYLNEKMENDAERERIRSIKNEEYLQNMDQINGTLRRQKVRKRR